LVRSIETCRVMDAVWPVPSDPVMVSCSFPSSGVWIVAVQVRVAVSMAAATGAAVPAVTLMVLTPPKTVPFASSCVTFRQASAAGDVTVISGPRVSSVIVMNGSALLPARS